jgi:predicted small lipoprotein YifL
MKLTASIAMMLALALSASACGRRGALEEPPYGRVISTDEAGKPLETPPPVSDRPFVLDPVLQ